MIPYSGSRRTDSFRAAGKLPIISVHPDYTLTGYPVIPSFVISRLRNLSLKVKTDLLLRRFMFFLINFRIRNFLRVWSGGGLFLDPDPQSWFSIWIWPWAALWYSYKIDGNLELGVHVRINLYYLICLRHLIRHLIRTEKLFSYMRVQHDLSYHLIWVPWAAFSLSLRF